MRSLEVNPRLLAAFHGLQMTLFPISIMTLFWKHHIGMTMTEILVVQAIFGLTMALAEFPSGYIADRIGYRRTLIWSSLLGIVGWSLYSVSDTMPMVIVSESILGVSIAMASGCDSALMYESLKELDQEQDFARWNGRVRFWGQTCEGTAALVAGMLYIWSPWLPFAMQAVVWTVNLGIASRMVEPARHVAPVDSHWRQIGSMVHHTLVGDRHLTAVVALTIVLGMAGFVPVWLVPLYATGAGLPAEWIGPMWAFANYTVALGSLYSERITQAVGLMPALLLCVILIAVGYAGLALSFGVLGFAWYFSLTTMRGIFGPALHHEENRLIPSSDRAGFLSLRSLMFRLLFFVIGPIVGIAVDASGQHAVLAGLGVALTTLGFAAWLWLRRHHKLAQSS